MFWLFVFVLLGLVIAFFVVTIRSNLSRYSGGLGKSRKKGGVRQTKSGSQIINCVRCHAKLRVPVKRGKLMIHCPKCGAEFIHDSGPKPWSPASATAEKPPKKTTPPKTPKAPLDELDDYRPGGALRKQINTSPSDTREALLNLIAAWTAASLRTYLYDQTSALWEKVRGYGGRIESASLELSAGHLRLVFRFAKAPAPGHTFQYTYNEIAEKEGAAPILLSWDEILWVRSAALSRLADTVPNARMKNGRLLP